MKRRRRRSRSEIESGYARGPMPKPHVHSFAHGGAVLRILLVVVLLGAVGLAAAGWLDYRRFTRAPLPGAHAARRRGDGHAVEQHMALADHLLQVTARELAGQGGQHLVDALLVGVLVEQPSAPLRLERIGLGSRRVVAVEHLGVRAGLRH